VTREGKLVLLALGLLAAVLLALLAGKVWVPLWGIGVSDPRAIIMVELRIPRALLAGTIGAGLGLSGAALQGYTRNPLADPAILGISALAALGAVAAIFLGFGASISIVASFAMVGAGLAVVLLGVLSGRSASAVTFVLAGTVLSSLAGALTALLLTLSPNPFAISEMLNWLMGALTDRSWVEVTIALPLVLLGSAVVVTQRHALDALALGEEVAMSLGVSLGRMQWALALGLALIVGGSVAVTGIVGFVGLIVPHVLRPFFGARTSLLLVPSALGGAILVLVADGLVRLVPGAGELRLGTAMALIGAPFFLALLLRLNQEPR
jgi:iron complex transport system permease protein